MDPAVHAFSRRDALGAAVIMPILAAGALEATIWIKANAPFVNLDARGAILEIIALKQTAATISP